MKRSAMQLVLFIVAFSAVLGGLHAYVWFRLVRSSALPPHWSRILGWTFVGLAVMVPVGLALGRALPRPVSTVIASFVFGWVGVLVIFFFLLLSSELVRLVAAAVWAAQDAPSDPERRTALSRLIAVVVGVTAPALAGVGVATVLRRVPVERVAVTLERFPKALSGYRIVQLTDVHVGPTIGREFIEAIVAQVNELDPHAVVITGDLVDGSVDELFGHVEALGALRARDGVYFVTGNHEYYSGVDEWLAALGRLGVRVLRNERVEIGKDGEAFYLAGVDDWSARRYGRGHGPDMARALAGRDPSREVVLLAHQPKHVDEAARHDVGLVLSGHTHGGQIFPWGLFVRLDQPFIVGLNRRERTQIYVSRGTGYWGPPMRVGAPPEITLLELHAPA